MAFFSERKACSTTKECKQTAATNCEGCSQPFCTKHLIEHRRALGEDMNAIISEQNQLQQIFNEQPTEPDSHPFMKRIDEWEKESIAKIQQKANDLRLELIQLTAIRRGELSKKLRQMSTQLNESRENDNFIEIDLQQWRNTLKDLQSMLDLSTMVSFEEPDNSPLLQNISLMFTIENELFEQVFDNIVQIKQNGHIAIHDTSYNYTEIRGKNEYTSGCHKIRLHIEQSADSWTFLGINSKLTPLRKQLSGAKSAYGWTNNNYIWLNGECLPNISSPRIQMKTNDVISLIFNCDKRKISMINERTNTKYELDVKIEHCPFPWQLHLNLYEANSCVRILSA
jgi:hypothetical protein